MKWVRNHFMTKEVSNMDDQSIQHTRWNCTYHIVFIPKYRRKILYGGNKRDVGEILKKLCEMKSVNLIEGKACVDHIHMYVAIPPKLSVSEFMSYLKGKSALMFFDRHPEARPKWGDRHLWARGYVSFQKGRSAVRSRRFRNNTA